MSPLVTLLAASALCHATTVGRPGIAHVSVAAPPVAKPAKGSFLVATRQLTDPPFARTVILLVEYTDTGAMGIVVNRPTELRLSQVLPDLTEAKGRQERIFWGGPVAVNLVLTLIRATSKPAQSQPIFADVYATGNRAAVARALGTKGKGNRIRIYAGHAGWAPGQLDGEIARGDWQVMSADVPSIFDTAPDQVWETLTEAHTGDWTQRDGPDAGNGIAALSAGLTP